MSMVKPVEIGAEGLGERAGRPVGDRTLEIMAELQLAEALGRVTAKMELEEREVERFGRFSAKARTAARLLGRKVRVRKLGDDMAEMTLLVAEDGE